MPPTRKELADALLIKVEASLSLNCIKGWPFHQDTSTYTTPIAAILWAGSETATTRNRLSDAVTVRRDRFDFFLFARNEPGLWSLLDSATQLFDDWSRETIGSNIVNITTGDIERYGAPGDVPETQAYAAFATVFFTFSV